MKVTVDFGLCEANGVCMGLAPDVFDLADDDMLTILTPEPSSADEPVVLEAVRQCPRQAISVDY